MLVVLTPRTFSHSWDHFFFTFFKNFQTLGLGISVLGLALVLG